MPHKWNPVPRAVLLLALVTACSPDTSRAGPLRLELSAAGGNTRLALYAVRGDRINARLKPALELADGRVLRFDSPSLTSDSAYFADPPATVIEGRHARVHGRLRASVCDANETVCRSITQEL